MRSYIENKIIILPPSNIVPQDSKMVAKQQRLAYRRICTKMNCYAVTCVCL